MKLSVNFVEYPIRKIKYMGISIFLLNMTLMLGIIHLVLESGRFHSENQVLVSKKEKMQIKMVTLKESAKNLPNKKNLMVLQARVKIINAVIKKHSYNSGSVLDVVEKSAPSAVFLRNYSHDSKTGAVVLKAVSSKNKYLMKFFKNLEADSGFRKVLLVRRDTVKEQGKLKYRVEIRLEQVI